MKWNEEIKWKVTGLEQNVLIDYRVTKNFNYICCGSILSLVQIFFYFVSNSLSCYYHTLPYPKTKEKKIWTKDKIEPQHIHSQYHFLLRLSRHFHSNVLECCWLPLLHYQATGVTCSSSKTTGFLSMHANKKHIYLIDRAHN